MSNINESKDIYKCDVSSQKEEKTTSILKMTKQQKWYLKNKEKADKYRKAYRKKYYKEHAEKLKEYGRKYWKEHYISKPRKPKLTSEEIRKRNNERHKRNYVPRIRKPKTKITTKEKNQRYYRKHLERLKLKNKIAYQIRKAKLSGTPCPESLLLREDIELCVKAFRKEMKK